MFNFNISNTLKICVYIVDFYTQPQIRNFVCCGLMGWDLIRLVMPMAGIDLQIAADVHSYPLPHDAA